MTIFNSGQITQIYLLETILLINMELQLLENNVYPLIIAKNLF